MTEKPDLMLSRTAFHAEAVSRLVRMEKTGEGIPAADVFDYLRKLVQGKPVARPRLRKIA